MNEEYKTYTFSLFNKPSFIRGLGRLWDFKGLLNNYNKSVSPQTADYKALRGDWSMVGNDMRQAITEFQKQYGKQQ